MSSCADMPLSLYDTFAHVYTSLWVCLKTYYQKSQKIHYVKVQVMEKCSNPLFTR